MNFAESSYRKHRENWEDDRHLASDLSTFDSSQETADDWRHSRMFEPVDFFLHQPDWQWLTIGDGRYGLDSVKISRLGIKNTLPTDIGETLLKQAKEAGIISDYGVENAESLSFDDNWVDVSFCKESYHHFPRPAVALYEMLRVSRKAVILIEPRDYTIDRPPYRFLGPLGLVRGLIDWSKRKMSLPRPALPASALHLLGDPPHYEEAGNYMYTVSSREFEKVALGMNLPAIAFKGLNDCYLPGAGKEPANDDSETFRTMKREIADADKRSQAGENSTGLLMTIFFIEPPDDQMRQQFSDSDWLFVDLPRNPCVESARS